MKLNLDNFLKFIGLDTGEPIPHPFTLQEQTAPDRPRTIQRTEQPDNLVYHVGRAFLQEQTAPDTVEDTLYTGAGTRNAEIGTGDKDMIYRERLDEGRYRVLKAYWVAGLSAAEAAKQFRGKRGYSPRTLDNYWKAFNAVQAALNPSPSPQ